ncbi:hypothetical protein BJY01DRAFT_127446 [Aspergillus pseudoustus]|uniref:Transcription factor domain-containing protein n=1 Tax=Aspergillus pseudoustus TaxID=1810923 RepID=A0ABR4IM58_9EURO
MSDYTDADDPHLPAWWMSNVIFYARAGRIHGHEAAPYLTTKQRVLYKRVWSSILLRDRLLALAFRSKTQFDREHGTPTQDHLQQQDMASDIEHSDIYSMATKRGMAKIAVLQSYLGMVLSRVTDLCYPGPNNLGSSASNPSATGTSTLDELSAMEVEPAEWNKTTELPIPTPKRPTHAHPSITLFRGVLYIYEKSTRLAILHHRAIFLEKYHFPVTPEYDAQRSAVETQLLFPLMAVPLMDLFFGTKFDSDQQPLGKRRWRIFRIRALPSDALQRHRRYPAPDRIRS